MAVGDVVNGMSALNTIMDFQPAVGVECMITAFSAYNSYLYIYNGANFVYLDSGLPVVEAYGSFVNCKIFINNTRYVRIPVIMGGSGYSFYCGIQTK